MPASRSTSRSPDPRTPAPRRRSLVAIFAIAAAAALLTLAFALPATLAAHFLPPPVRASDLSGSLWHGSAGRLEVNGVDAGAVEWRLSPAALFALALAGDLHWVRGDFALDGSLRITSRGLAAENIHGGGTLQSLAGLGLPGGVAGTATIALSRLDTDANRLTAIAGEIDIAGLSLQPVGGGADLGGYALHFGADAVAADGTVTARLADTGGPLQLEGTVSASPAQRTGLISGTLQERAGVPGPLAGQIESLSQMRGRDREGRIPIDLEFAF